MILGIDLGSSATKLALVENGTLLETRRFDASEPLETVLESIAHAAIHTVALTGLNSAGADLSLLPAGAQKVLETEAIARGGGALAGLDRAIIISIGTGTAYLALDGAEIRHLGGTGVGGGTLTGFARWLGLESGSALTELSLEGNYDKVDLLIGDLYPGDRDLDPRLTASNLAKLHPDASRADLAAGLVNLCLQVIGTISLFAARGAEMKEIVVTGALARSEAARRNFANFERCYPLRWHLPERAEYATAYGAALLAQNGADQILWN